MDSTRRDFLLGSLSAAVVAAFAKPTLALTQVNRDLQIHLKAMSAGFMEMIETDPVGLANAMKQAVDLGEKEFFSTFFFPIDKEAAYFIERIGPVDEFIRGCLSAGYQNRSSSWLFATNDMLKAGPGKSLVTPIGQPDYQSAKRMATEAYAKMNPKEARPLMLKVHDGKLGAYLIGPKENESLATAAKPVNPYLVRWRM